MPTLPRRWRMIGGRLLAALGVSAIPIGILAPLAPAWWEKKWWLVIGVLVLAAGWALLGLRRREPHQTYRDINVVIRLVFGDLFEQNASFMIGMTSTFDTDPDPQLGIIAPTSLQARFLNTFYGGSVPQLDQALNVALRPYTPIRTINKPGKQDVYPIGTVATLTTPARICHHCVAYTTMDTTNRATGTIRGVLDSLDNTWEAVDKSGNGGPICVPLIGQGQSRITELASAEIAVRLIAFSFLLRSKRSRFASELRIVVRDEERAKINTMEFQAFLTSMAAA